MTSDIRNQLASARDVLEARKKEEGALICEARVLRDKKIQIDNRLHDIADQLKALKGDPLTSNPGDLARAQATLDNLIARRLWPKHEVDKRFSKTSKGHTILVTRLDGHRVFFLYGPNGREDFTDRNTLITNWRTKERILHLPNWVDPDNYATQRLSDTVLEEE